LLRGSALEGECNTDGEDSLSDKEKPPLPPGGAGAIVGQA